MDVIENTHTEELKKAIFIAQSLAKEHSNATYSPAHLLRALLHKDVGLFDLLMSWGKDVYYMEEWAEVRIESYPKSSKINTEPSADDQVIAIMNEAEEVKIKLSKEAVDPMCVLASISTPGVGFNYDQLKTFPITSKEIIDKAVESSDLINALGDASQPQVNLGNGKSKKTPLNALLKYTIDRTQLALQKQTDPVIGRDHETRTITEILGRRSKPNVIIIGERGVGKTALIDGFIKQLIHLSEQDQSFPTMKVFEVDLGALIAGASYKGEVEERLKNIFQEIKNFDKAALFIDEIHTLIDKNGGVSGAANLLKSELGKGEVIIIGTTSLDDYRKHVESDAAFSRQFEVIKLEEPSPYIAFRMLKEIVPNYVDHHDLKIDDEVLKEAVRLAKRFVKDRYLPDSAIDLIDRTMSVVKLAMELSEEEINDFKTDLEETIEQSKGDENKLKEELRWLYASIRSKISPALLIQFDDNIDINQIEDTAAIISYIESFIDYLNDSIKQKRESITPADVAAVVADKTGIPLGKLQQKERERLLKTEDHLMKRVVGQEHAIKSVAEAILESRSGLSKPGQPIGSFFFLGPTGTGKTELAKSLADFLFQDESAMIRFDMSEFKEEHSAALLYGAPPGYVGYQEGGLLVNKIRQQPYAVILFDEIEKAHRSVFDVFLQIMDEGKLHDKLGKEGDFSNALILFTSNIGSDYIVESFNNGKIPPSNDLMNVMAQHFRPEFLGRLTEIVPFAPISEKVVVRILEIQIQQLLKQLEGKGIELLITDKAKENLAKSGFSPKYGARPLAGAIRSRLRRPLSKMIISGEIKKGNKVKVDTDKKNQLTWKIT